LAGGACNVSCKINKKYSKLIISNSLRMAKYMTEEFYEDPPKALCTFQSLAEDFCNKN